MSEEGNQTFHFPEDSLNLKKTGVCFSGGGTRAMTCAIGQMKGLWKIGAWDSIGYISAVSGGCWASSIFTYYQTGAGGPDNDLELLGETHAPEELTISQLGKISEKFMGHAVTRDFEGELILKIIEDDAFRGIIEKPDEVWIDCVGHTYLKPFGLYEDHKKYFTLNAASRDEILARKKNKHLSADEFYLVHDQEGDIKRPYLVMNSTLLAPAEDLPVANAENLTVFNYTPLGVGAARRLDIDYATRYFGSHKALVGGGFIDPFAMGGLAPRSLPVSCGSAKWNAHCAKVKLSRKPFRLADAVGTSSAAFSADIAASILEIIASDIVFSGNPVPEQEYWPVQTQGITEAKRFRFADGGNLENLGVISLLQRKVKKLIVFINTNVPLDLCFIPKGDSIPSPTTISSDVYPLFGYEGEAVDRERKAAVFQKKDFWKLFDALKAKREAGKSVMHRQTLVTIENSTWGIQKGDTVEVLWVYNSPVEEWERQLPDSTRAEIKKGKKGMFPDFPQYKLMFEDKGHLLKYTPEMVNLLYELQAWNVYANKEMFDFILK